LRLAFLYIAEAYQVYHAAAVMFELMRRPGVSVDVYHIDPETPAELETLRKVHGADPFESRPLPPGILGAVIQAPRIFGLAKPQVLARNERMLRVYDAVISTEDGIVRLFRGEPANARPKRILITHGADARAVPDREKRRDCDLILAKGERDVALHLEKGHAEEGQIVAAGYPKFTSLALLDRAPPPLFGNRNPIVLYNPHKEPSQRSWGTFFEPLMEGFEADRSRNLLVAPHIKLFRRRSPAFRRKLEARSRDNIRIDVGSRRLLDGSYLERADIYVGDVSSQVYEFLARPRPCVFLDAHNVDWRSDPTYAMWHLGEVVGSPAELMPAIRRASQMHEHFRERQIEAAARSLGDTTSHSVIRSADLICDFIAKSESMGA